MKTFDAVKEKYLTRLDQYVPIVARIHGDSHPEFHDVHRLFKTIRGKIKETGSTKTDLANEFIELRKITDNYNIPNDVCESYEAVYNMLSEMDEAYHN